MSKQSDDLEAGSPLLSPSLQENPEFRWAFIRKVYAILTVQLLVTFGFAALVAAVQPVATFFKGPAFWPIYIGVIVLTIFAAIALGCTKDFHPWNFIFLGMITLCFGFLIGILASFTTAQVFVEAVLATILVVVALTIYTFWAAKRGEDFGFLVPVLLSVLIISLMFGVFQFVYPGKVTDILLGGACVIILSIYIIFDTELLIKRYSYDDYIFASLSLYLDVLRIFVVLLSLFRSRDE